MEALMTELAGPLKALLWLYIAGYVVAAGLAIVVFCLVLLFFFNKTKHFR